MFFSYRNFLLVACCFLNAVLMGVDSGERSIMTVQGRAELRKPADEVILTLGVVSQAETAGEALGINNQKIQAILQEMRHLGLADTDYQTSQFTLEPVYSLPPRDPQPDWSPVIKGYKVTNQIAIRTEQLNLAGLIIDRAAQAGANTVEQVSFDIKNQRAYQLEALALATQRAIENAQQLAQVARIQLLRILSISTNHGYPVSQPRTMAFAFKSGEGSDIGTSIVSGQVEISADVTILYEIH